MNPDGDRSWARQLLVAVGALLAVALVIGGVVSAFALGAAQISGIDDPGTRTAPEPSVVSPSSTPDTGQEPSAQPPRPRRAITLRAVPATVRAGERINLNGAYPSGTGAQLQVQRFEAGWSDFQVTITVTGQRFSTYVVTTRPGVSRFRVVDASAGRASNEVRVTVD